MHTFIRILKKYHDNTPDKAAFVFLDIEGKEKETLSYKTLFQKAKLLSTLMPKELNTGDRVLLLHQSGLGPIISLFACWMRGLIATPLPLNYFRKRHMIAKHILNDVRPSLILHDGVINKGAHEIPQIPDIDTTKLQILQHTDHVPHPGLNQFKESDIAILQYTSGSISMPKGVEVTHANVLANSEMIKRAMNHDERSTFCGWVPFFHDQGLIGNILQPIYIGATCVLMSPQTFTRNPLLWIRTISKYRVHTSGGPNFAYALCRARYKKNKMQDVDLSSWKVAFNGAETIRYETLKEFSRCFREHGFKESALYPSYGLAEATLMVTGKSGDNPVFRTLDQTALLKGKVKDKEFLSSGKHTTTLVSSGQALNKEGIRIVDPLTQTKCESEKIGEIWLSGEHIAKGYRSNAHETRHTFTNYIRNEEGGIDDEVNYLRTGDLGFMDKQGEVFILSRIKDLIIKYGNNLIPDDIEFCVSTCDQAFDPHRCIVFSIDRENEEDIIVIQEVRREHLHSFDKTRAGKAVRKSLQEQFGCTPKALLFSKPNSIKLTTSGKKQRQATKTSYLQGEIESL